MKSTKNPKIILGHDILTKLGGAEQVLKEFTKIYPNAQVFTLVYDKKFTDEFLPGIKITASFLQSLPMNFLGKNLFRYYLPLMPLAWRTLKIPKNTGLVLINSSSFAKFLQAPPNIPYILYLNTPTRFLWKDKDWFINQSGNVPSIFRKILTIILNKIKREDYLVMKRPNIVIANSKWIATQIKKYYNRIADFSIFPPVNLDKFSKGTTKKENYFLVVGRIEPYKNVELAIKAAIKAKVNLKIAGDGSQKSYLKTKYKNSNIEFLGKVSDSTLTKLYAGAQCLIFPQEEDAGIVPLEAMASATPVIALESGGALESIVPGKTGEFFKEENEKSLALAIKNFNPKRYNKSTLINQAKKFSSQNFRQKIRSIIEGELSQKN